MRPLFSALSVVAIVLFVSLMNGLDFWLVFNWPSMALFAAVFVAASTWSFPLSHISEALSAATGTSPLTREQGARYSEMFNRLSSISIATGVMGSLVGFVHMLQNMDDPSNIGTAIAVGLVTTVYGVLVSELLCRPWGNHCLACVDEALTK